MFNFLKSKTKPRPFTLEEAALASTAQDEIAAAITSLLALVDRGTCNPKLPKKIMALAKLLEDEAKINHNVITTFLEQHEKK